MFPLTLDKTNDVLLSCFVKVKSISKVGLRSKSLLFMTISSANVVNGNIAQTQAFTTANSVFREHTNINSTRADQNYYFPALILSAQLFSLTPKVPYPIKTSRLDGTSRLVASLDKGGTIRDVKGLDCGQDTNDV